MLSYEAYLTPGIYKDFSSSVTTGGTSQTAIPLNAKRRRIVIQNPATATSQGIGTAESLFINFTTGASTSKGNSIELLAGGSYDSDSGPCTTELVTIVAATTGHQYCAKEMV